MNIYWRFLNGIIGEVRFKKSATEEKNTIYVKLKNTKSSIIERKGEEIVTFRLCDLRKFISCMDDPGYGLLCKTS